MTKRQIKKAARLYSLAVVAHIDLCGENITEADEVIATEAVTSARKQLERLGYSSSNLLSLEQCRLAISNA